MPGAPKNATTAYGFYCNEKRLSVAQMYPDRSKSDITKIMSAQWKKLSAGEKQPFVHKHVGDKVRYQRELEAFKVIVGAEKVDELEEANKAEQEGQKRKKAIEKVDRDATKRQRILELNMRSKIPLRTAVMQFNLIWFVHSSIRSPTVW
jgi:hypothetical protein